MAASVVFLIRQNTNDESQCVKALFHSSQKPTPKLATKTFTQSQYLKTLAASLRVSFCDEWKIGLTVRLWPFLLAYVFDYSGTVKCKISNPPN